MSNLDRSDIVILGVIALIIIGIVILGIAKNWRKGWKWVLALIVAAIFGYLWVSGKILRVG